MFEVKLTDRKLSVWEEWFFKGNGPFQLPSFKKSADLEKRLTWLTRGNWNRQKLFDWLGKEVEDLKLFPEQEKNLDLIKMDNSYFIVTGQQPGLLGGPIYWLYKALTAAELSKEMSRQLNVNVIPLFWIAGDDSDLRECNKIEHLESTFYREEFHLAQNAESLLIPMSQRKLGGGNSDLINKLGELWPNCIELIENLLQENFSFTQSFKNLFQKQLGETGILLCDGGSAHYRQVAQDSVLEIINNGLDFESAFKSGTDKIKLANKTPVSNFRPGTLHGFYLDGNLRERITKKGDQYFLVKDTDNPLDLDKAAEYNLLSHDGMSRLSVIDKILPNLGHVLGPGEMGYFTQLFPVFEKLSQSCPLVYPRMSSTIIKQVPEKFGLDLQIEELLQLNTGELKKILITKSHPSIQNYFKELEKNIRESLDQVNMVGPVKFYHKTYPESHQKFLKNLQREISKYQYQMDKNYYTNTSSDYEPLFELLNWLGDGKGQDRHLNIFSVMDFFSTDEFQQWMNTLNPLEHKHQLITYRG